MIKLFRTGSQVAGVWAVVPAPRVGLRAVKVLTDDGTAEYAICDELLRPIYPSAKSLDGLWERFPELRPQACRIAGSHVSLPPSLEAVLRPFVVRDKRRTIRSAIEHSFS